MLAAKNAGIDGCLFTPDGAMDGDTCARWRIRSLAELDALVGLPEEEAR